MRNILVIFILSIAQANGNSSKIDFQGALLTSKKYSESVKLIIEYKKHLEQSYQIDSDRYPFAQIAMLDNITKNITNADDCAASESRFKLSFYDYRTKENSPQKDVTKMAQIFRHVCELKKREAR